MKIHVLRVWLVVLAAAAPVGAVAEEAPTDFVRAFYSTHAKPRNADAADLDRWLDPPLLALFRKQHFKGKEPCGRLDYNGFTGAQDEVGPLTMVEVARAENPTQIHVAFESKAEVRVELKRVGTGWRISNVFAPEVQSLVASLTRVTAEKCGPR